MKRRLVAALAAVLSAVLGAGLLLSYVAGADRRAMAGMQTTQVLVAAKDVPAGTSGTALEPLVTVKTLPVAALAPGAVHDLAAVQGLVATSDLKRGEQVLASRFADPATLADASRPKVPPGMQQLTLELQSQRVVGGELAPGARVGVFVTVKERTHLTVPSVLVTRVVVPSSADDSDKAAAPAEGTVRITLALRPADAEKVVFGVENGTIWLSQVTQPSPTRGTRVVSRKNVFK